MLVSQKILRSLQSACKNSSFLNRWYILSHQLVPPLILRQLPTLNMRKRSSSAQINPLAKRQQSNANLCGEAGAGQDNGEAAFTTLNLSHAGQRSNDVLVHRLSDMIQQEDINPCSKTQGEKRHTTTPTESSFSWYGRNSLDFQAMEESFQEMKVRDPDHSLSEFTKYQPGLENTEVRYKRMFVVPLYDRDNHRYHLPVDEEEVDRLEIGHTCWLTTAKLLYPRIQPGMIMDLGTGNGRWVQEVAEIKPDCKVIGIDQYYLDTPSTFNQADFEADDCELDFAERQETVTMVNVRDSFLWIRDHRTLTKRVHEISGQDGWFQNQETRLSEWNSDKPRVCQWRDKALAGARELGIQLHTATEMRQALDGAGFVEYRDERLTWTIEQLPELWEYAILTINATIGMLYDAWGESAELKGVVDGAVQDLEANDCHIEIGVDICWAKKFRR